MNVEKICQELSSSPLFNLSLSSKELFHSNFIDWLCNNFQEEMGNIFGPFVDNSKDKWKIDRSLPEHKKIDITVYFKSGKKLIIENKVKSIPGISQLKKISDKEGPDNSYLLLTLVPPSLMPDKWNKLTYAEFSKHLSEQLEMGGFASSSDYIKFLVTDYIQVINLLNAVVDHFSNPKHFEEDTFSNFYESLKPFKEIRIDDLLIKIRYQQITNAVYQKLKGFFKQLDLGDKQGTIPFDTCNITTGMYNGKGSMAVNLHLPDEISVCVLIDEIRFGIGVRSPNVNTTETFFELKKREIFDIIPIENLSFVKEKRRKSNHYNYFDGRKHKYRWRYINGTVQMKDLVSNICDIVIKLKKELQASNSKST